MAHMHNPRGTPDILGNPSSQFRGQSEENFEGLAQRDGCAGFESHAPLGKIQGLPLMQSDGVIRDGRYISWQRRSFLVNYKTDRYGAGFSGSDAAINQGHRFQVSGETKFCKCTSTLQ